MNVEDSLCGVDTGSVISLSTFHARMLLYHLPLYSLASISKDTLSNSFSLMSMELIFSSPNTSKTTRFGYCSFVSRTYEHTFHFLPVLEDVPSRGSNTLIIFPCISMIIFLCWCLLRDRMCRSMSWLYHLHNLNE
jgi:hypothetical protein